MNLFFSFSGNGHSANSFNPNFQQYPALVSHSPQPAQQQHSNLAMNRLGSFSPSQRMHHGSTTINSMRMTRAIELQWNYQGRSEAILIMCITQPMTHHKSEHHSLKCSHSKEILLKWVKHFFQTFFWYSLYLFFYLLQWIRFIKNYRHPLIEETTWLQIIPLIISSKLNAQKLCTVIAFKLFGSDFVEKHNLSAQKGCGELSFYGNRSNRPKWPE